MNSTISINQEVNVTAVYFHSKGMKTYPRRMEWGGTTYTFRDGLQYLIKRGQDMVQIFEMTDGASNYRLRREGEHSNWTLVTITPSA